MLKSLKSFFHFFFITIIKNKRRLVFSALDDIWNQNNNKVLGLIWIIIRPILFILLVSFAVIIGFRHIDNDISSYVVFFGIGYICWLFFVETLSNSILLIRKKHSLLSRVDYDSRLVPMAIIIKNLITHLILLALMISLSSIYLDINFIFDYKILFSIMMYSIFLLGLVFLISSICVYFPDLEEIFKMVMQFGFWMTPILWSHEKLGLSYQWVIKYNPIFYFISSYRESLLGNTFSAGVSSTITLALLALLSLFIGFIIFDLLKDDLFENL